VEAGDELGVDVDENLEEGEVVDGLVGFGHEVEVLVSEAGVLEVVAVQGEVEIEVGVARAELVAGGAEWQADGVSEECADGVVDE